MKDTCVMVSDFKSKKTLHTLPLQKSKAWSSDGNDMIK